VRQEALNAIHTTVQHSAHLVKQLLSFTRFESLNAKRLVLVDTDVRAVVLRVLESFALTAQQVHIDLGFDGTDHAVWCQSEPVLLQEMLSNLVDNALRYTPCGGVVTVGVTQEQGRTLIFVQDNGPGIAPAERERVFERFYRLDANTEGSGLGLSIVREIAQNLKISLELTQPSAGSGLVVRLIF
jgi:two-component system sensor histidine kinase TctE